ncbi:MAG TPA: hypothetical protein VFL82_03915 [Thermomicrobiales bacterium]|jgi:hypothetical protein|nr:hypothetical protein [Thermomicrobiales bacterium]
MDIVYGEGVRDPYLCATEMEHRREPVITEPIFSRAATLSAHRAWSMSSGERGFLAGDAPSGGAAALIRSYVHFTLVHFTFVHLTLVHLTLADSM